MNILPNNMRFGAGQPVKRLEDQRLLTGKGQFIDDKPDDGALWLYVLRSPHAHAKILSIDTAAAREIAGVQAIYTGADLVADDVGTIPTLAIFKRPDGKPMTVPPRRLLAHEVVRYTGEAVAAVVATSRVIAQEAAEAIVVDYEVLPAVTDPVQALEPGAPVVWAEAPDNIVAAMSYGDAAKVEEAFASAPHKVSLDIVSQRLVPSAMEPRSTIAEIEKKTGRLLLYVQSQTPASTRDVLAEAVLKRPKESVRVLVGDIGGGFGQKTNLYPEDGIVAYAATKLAKKIRWRAERTDEFVGGTHGRDLTSTAEFALDAKGKVLAYRVRSIGATGAYSSGAANIIPLVLGPFVQTGVYDLPLVHFEVKTVMTHTAPVGAYRGAGRPEAVFIVERLFDTAARQIGIDPRTIRKANYIKPAQLPYTNAVGQVYDSGAFAHMLERASKLADWDGFNARKREAKKRGMLYGRGLTSYIEWTGGRAHTEKVSLHATSEGRVILHSGTMAMGQGLQTTYTQMISDTLGIPLDKIDVVQGDTDLATGFGSVGSRSLFVGGTAVAVSSNDLMTKAREKASNLLETAVEDIEYRDGFLTVVGTDRRISLFEIAQKEQGAKLSVDSEGEVDGPSWPNGTHICEVEIDPETGISRVVRYTTVDDVGVAVNPMLVAGQIHGGVAQGIGQALYENVAYDADGQLLTATYQDYCIPRADDVPPIVVTLDDSAPCKTNPLGSKGCGESGAIGGPPCVTNGVMDALFELGITNLQTPLTPEKVWAAIRDAKAKKAAA
ncbi:MULTISPECIES: xanthine dehydrogenase family protein molybdopterin-binding subunit [Bradyrhizobium]|jgi:carbon-monoxide dehydrogenase large subunit|uniref:Xanthine dehydrogenase family protein molybdopterin-binding subunit n=8 Tax=Bradyrhizobium TaxID=374 RepID=A0ABS5GD94_9BRAD|nr:MULTISPECIES: xanthine dehydrogenase family protein molybdopterin-binding subunit [Bradyrhizobium]MBR1139296.1 xanthine dehydrogenase family protein molybdopterin-binding subunit [Bradyrhizobium denitrificans]MDU1495233.1 xanthine dehydrogenase family protein molybdopterin-binding subunit [Bradyrhizobium sp.]MDU1545320.1 xanthine dehydrogenase family protein molybdopterin-binding subunit [Bradyrhizobium sp.]MDU2922861.1 xanthine dehydrogenase family protein molybdopterin-binding subunit [Bra